MTVDVVIAGGGPTGLMLAGELRLGGADAIVLERLPAPTGLSKALGLVGRAVQTLNYRGLLERFDAGFVPAAMYSRFAHLGGIALDVGRLIDSAPAGYFPPPLPGRLRRRPAGHTHAHRPAGAGRPHLRRPAPRRRGRLEGPGRDHYCPQ